MDYQAFWLSKSSIDDFAGQIAIEWIREYLDVTAANAGDVVDVDPGNGFTYTFDLAGSLDAESCVWEPRVVGVWGRSQPGGPARDKSRMRGFPRPKRGQDDRGHLVSCAAGGGYDINLVAMDSALNRGHSPEGKRFRDLERRSAAVPGSLFFVRPVYDDDTARPCRFEVGAQDGADLIVDSFSNDASHHPIASSSPLRQAAAMPIDTEVVVGCLDMSSTGDELFARGFQRGVSSLNRPEKNAVAGVTGHVAESVTEILLDAIGWRVLWHFTGPGRHGVDLVFHTPDEKIVAVEVKGTLVSGKIPHLTRRDLARMSAAWVDKTDNPGMVELGLDSTDVYGAVVVINFADLTWRVALTDDFTTLRPTLSVGELADPSWLGRDAT
jgi:hypothetical protein